MAVKTHIQESRKKFDELHLELVRRHNEYSNGGWTQIIFGDRWYNEEGVKKFFEHMKGKDFVLDEKDDRYSRFIRETYSFSMKAKYVIGVEIKSMGDGRFRVLLWEAVYFKKKSAKSPYFKVEVKKKYPRSL